MQFDLTGSALANWLTGNSSVNVLRGLGGVDRLDGGTGRDVLIGGLGNDVYLLDDITGSATSFAFDSVTEVAGEGLDIVRVPSLDINPSGADSYTLGDNVKNGIVDGAGAFTLLGNALGLVGNNADNSLLGYPATTLSRAASAATCLGARPARTGSTSTGRPRPGRPRRRAT